MNGKTSIQTVLLGALLLFAGTLWFRNGNSAGAAGRDVSPGTAYKPMNVENPLIHLDRLTALQETESESTGRDIFNWKLPAPPPPMPIRVLKLGDEGYVAPEVPPPPPPKLPLKFFGIGTDSKGSARRAFLTDGEEVFVVAEGDTLLGHFRVLKITTARLDFEEIRSGRRASKPLEEQGAGM